MASTRTAPGSSRSAGKTPPPKKDGPTLSPQQLDEFKKAFHMFDLDGDGRITSKELAKTVRVLGKPMTEEEVKIMIAEGDKDNNGSLDFEEFCDIMAKEMAKTNPQEDLKKAFKVFDIDGDGLISSAELRHVMMNLGEKLTKSEADLMIKDADINGDGFIDYNEFIAMMTKK